ncbi:type II secretion system F family protein [Nocardioides zeae]|uniref:Type II secretion system F family protein n=1 Tax=Nocardioides imazamoxiresistens TaxID=3231893 RepID=A0ABU3PZT2_9ACTN|nr:type II secretion system F family protein [Nocardioides zeae]MDT9594761.1 type II secretion system F family protein [Nocardioides zeae]
MSTVLGSPAALVAVPGLVAGAALAVAVLLALPSRPGPVRTVGRDGAGGARGGSSPPGDRVQAYAPLWCLGAVVGVVSFVDGPLAWPAALAAGAGLWVLLRRSEPASVRRRRDLQRRDLPAFVELYGAALGSGAPTGAALETVRAALPGPVADDLAPVAARLALGVDAGVVWGALVAEAGPLAPLGRVMARAHESGAAVTPAVLDLADALAAQGRAEVEDRARTVGVRAAVPLGVCLLPAFLLLGIVPLVAAAVDGLGW